MKGKKRFIVKYLEQMHHLSKKPMCLNYKCHNFRETESVVQACFPKSNREYKLCAPENK